MTELSFSPALNVYILFAVALCILLLVIDSVGGSVRGKTKTSLNPEDPAVKKGGKLVDADPDGVARVMRAHRNAMANIIPFLLLTLLYVIRGGSAQHILWVCSVFTFARIVHAVAYIRALQPWRSIAFGLGQLCTLAVAVRIVLAAIPMLQGIY